MFLSNFRSADVHLALDGQDATPEYSRVAKIAGDVRSALARIDEACLLYELAAQCARFIKTHPSVAGFKVLADASNEMTSLEGEAREMSIKLIDIVLKDGTSSEPPTESDPFIDAESHFYGLGHLADALLQGATGDEVVEIDASQPDLVSLLSGAAVSGKEALRVLMPEWAEKAELAIAMGETLAADIDLSPMISTGTQAPAGGQQ
ncbi:MAG: hypothetical protein O9327_02470 [Polaromonas sp.]|nr:hypothetical protein [Polaromonas sp.]